MPLCKVGFEWSFSEKKCVPRGTRLTERIERRREAGLITPVADYWEKRREEGKATPIADFVGYQNPDIVEPEPEPEPPPYIPPKVETPADCAPKGMVWSEAEGRCVATATSTGDEDSLWQPRNPGYPDQPYTPVAPDYREEPIVQDVPTSLYPGQEALNTQLAGLLSTQGQDEAEQAMWDTTMTRLNKEYQKTKDQLNEDLNVKGLYYSGVRGEKLQELADDYNQIVAETQAKFNYERFNRRLQQNQQAINYALGAKGQEIQMALGKGQLSLGQLDLALQESLGMNTLDLKNRGMLNDFVSGLAYIGIAQAQTDIQRQQVWTQIVQVLYQMGLSENDINAIWLQVSGQQNNPPV